MYLKTVTVTLHEMSLAATAGCLIARHTTTLSSMRFGRKHVFFTSIILTFLAGFATTFSPNVIFYMVGQLTLGFFHSGVYIVSIVIGIEIVTEGHRAMGVTMIMCTYAFGYMLVAVLALLLKSNWQRLLFTISITWLVYFPYYWIVPESLRWLINRRRFMKAHALVDRIAEHNKVELPANFYKKCFPSSMNEPHQKRTIVDLFKRRRLFGRVCIACIIWFSISCTYFGIYLEAGELSMSPYLRPVVTTIVEIPSFLLTWFLVTVIGRRTMLTLNTAFAGLSLIASVFVGHFIVSMTFLFIGKLFAACSYAVAHIITLEFLPTPVRSVGFGLSFAFSCLGAVVCPSILQLSDIWRPLPFLVFSLLSLASAGLALLLPKTVSKKLPETMEEGDALKRRGSRMYETDGKDSENPSSGVKLQLESEDGL
ncbi:organic cation transporter protein-like isoform X2 [Ptychodera flava]|uniref:organic cation transporter protein-like isoform X2 n=1 Tax=Ptychodera flava TaxID=63121 RepID=UPI00396A6D12